MYAALWQILPGPAWLRILLLLVLLAGVLLVLSTWVFPWVDEIINTEEATVGGS
ncbi:hypothetical protein SAMN05216282_10567 [Cryobacterium psychrotolerans]|uniref:Uncharacterized protein n=1 Tax=Cryobacterium psychrotolerans TaxID=386301 RepID=A0A1G9B7C9_9MICO|nr:MULTISPECIES: hypothetical protein [Cryobacterium]SDK34940.1 hypothetical protein SAMN05216282_10567 [Cryobacterium psychrotolerans]